uniref:Secreted protein n=1 Tax=Panagrellus redivivus TaxID=6233 RepID=A0A7E4UT53_PANRE
MLFLRYAMRRSDFAKSVIGTSRSSAVAWMPAMCADLDVVAASCIRCATVPSQAVGWITWIIRSSALLVVRRTTWTNGRRSSWRMVKHKLCFIIVCF